MRRTRNKLFAILNYTLLLILFLTGACNADLSDKMGNVEIKVKGHAKTLWTFFIERGQDTGQNFILNSNRIQLEPKVFWGDNLSFNAVYDLEIFTGNLVSSPGWEFIRDPQSNSFWDLSWDTKATDAVAVGHSIYRAYIYYDADFAQFSVGKQRIAWGAMRFYRPTDLFNYSSPLQIEGDRKIGVDAVKVTTKPFLFGGDVEMVLAPSKLPGDQITAGKYHFLLGNYDMTIVGGKIRKNSIAGFTYNGYVGDGGFRGEAVRIKPVGEKEYYQWAVGGDYTFPNTLTLTLEYLNNGGATGKPINQFLPGTGILRTKNRQFLFLGSSYQLSPLVNLDFLSSYDLEGSSFSFFPRVRWDYARNVEISAGAAFFTGKPKSEYGNTPHTLFTQVVYYF